MLDAVRVFSERWTAISKHGIVRHEQVMVTAFTPCIKGKLFLNYKNKKMKAKTITYSRLISKGNYENEKIEICLEVEEGEKAADVFKAAKEFVEKRVEVAKLSDYTIQKAKQVLDDKRNHTIAQIEEAEEILTKSKIEDEDLPF